MIPTETILKPNISEKLSTNFKLHHSHFSGEENNNPENIAQAICNFLNESPKFDSKSLVVYNREKKRYEGFVFFRNNSLKPEDYTNPNFDPEMTYLTARAMANESYGTLGNEIYDQLLNLTPWQYLNCSIMASALEHKKDNDFDKTLIDIGKTLLKSSKIQTATMQGKEELSKECYAQINFPRIDS